jgi:hypothetical protein
MARPTLAVLALAAAVLLPTGCGGGSDTVQRSAGVDGQARQPAPAAIRIPPLRARVISTEHLRRAVLQGVGRDYLGGTQVGPPGFGLCLQRGLRRLLDERTLRSLAPDSRRPAGQQLSAQARNRLARPVGDRCGGRRFVPKLIEASMAFRAGHLRAAWRRSTERLVPGLAMPREVLSVGTFPMPVGGGGNCGREPVAAIRRMRPGDALISIQEYAVTARMRTHLTRSFPPKSRRLGLEGLRFGRLASEPGDPGDRGVPVTRGTIPFSEAGRAFDALVYFRGHPSEGLRSAAARVLAGLRFEQRG